MAELPGLELLFRSVTLKSNHDATICLLHWNFITNGFKCIGVGETTSPVEGPGSEILPDGWNESQDMYVLRYRTISSDGNEKDYLLKVILISDVLSVNLMKLQDEKVSSINLDTTEFVNTNYDTFQDTYKNVEQFKKTFDEKVMATMCPQSARSSWPQGQAESSRRPLNPDDLGPFPSGRPPRYEPNRGYSPWDPVNPANIGGRDLDPFGEGGGMIYDPMNYGRIPRLSSIRPRLDPIGPPGTRREPDHDHAPPPNYDDLFM